MVALARLKPAFISRDATANNDDSEQDLDEQVPPSPPPPGRRPGIRTRQPQPTTRVTRSQRQRNVASQQATQEQAVDEPTCAPSPQPAPSRSTSRQRSPSPDNSQRNDGDNLFPPASPPAVIRDPQFPDGTPDDPNLASDPTPPRDWPNWISSRPSHSQEARARQLVNDSNSNSNDNDQGGVRKRTLSFSKPKPGHFSYRRRRPDINALKNILTSIR